MNNLALLVACFALGVVLRRSVACPMRPRRAQRVHHQHRAAGADPHASACSRDHVCARPRSRGGVGAVCAEHRLLRHRRTRGRPRTAVGRRTDAHRRPREHLIPRDPDDRGVYGSAGVAQGLVIDQLGSYLALATLGSSSPRCTRRRVRPTRHRPQDRDVSAAPCGDRALLLRPLEYPEWLATTLLRLETRSRRSARVGRRAGPPRRARGNGEARAARLQAVFAPRGQPLCCDCQRRHRSHPHHLLRAAMHR